MQQLKHIIFQDLLNEPRKSIKATPQHIQITLRMPDWFESNILVSYISCIYQG